MPQNIVIIGAVALGPKAACRFKRLEPDSPVILLDKASRIAYGGCGIPFYVGGDVADIAGLQSTAFHMVRNPAFFHDLKGVEARPDTEALAIDRAAKTVTVRHLPTGREETLAYDQLVIATGSSPRRLPIPGMDLPGVHTVGNLDEAEAIKNAVAAGKANAVVVIGSGFIGLEMAVAFADMWGLPVTVIEVCDQVLPGVTNPSLAGIARHHMEEKDVVFRLAEQVTRIEGDGKAERVVTNKGTIEADLVIVSVGVSPNSTLAKAAGLAVSDRGGILVDATMRTSDPAIFAGGDCVEVQNLVTGRPVVLPLGSMANRQGSIIGDNLAGGDSRFPGVVGSGACGSSTSAWPAPGLTLEGARSAGFDAVSTQVMASEPGPFYPEHAPDVPGAGGRARHQAGARRPGGERLRRRPGRQDQHRGGHAAPPADLGRRLHRGSGLFPALRRGPWTFERPRQRRRQHPGRPQPRHRRGGLRPIVGRGRLLRRLRHRLPRTAAR